MIGDRIFQARTAAGLSLRQLAERMDRYVSAQVIHKYELGTSQPGSDVLIKLAKALGVKVEFFFRPETDQVVLSQPAFRRKATVSQKQRAAIQAKVRAQLERYLSIESLFPSHRFQSANFPSFAIDATNNLDHLEVVANDVRQLWSLGTDPIERLSEVLEDRGVKVVMLEIDFEIDGLSCWANDAIPVVLVKKNQPSDRLRLSMAHELGHLLLRGSDTVNIERAANRFAGAFLVPREAALRELGEHRSSFSLFELRSLREKYGMSVQAWIFRARDLGIISEHYFLQLFKHLKSSGLHKQEFGNDLPLDLPKRYERLVMQATEEGLISAAKGAEYLEISLNEYRKKFEGRVSDVAMRP